MLTLKKHFELNFVCAFHVKFPSMFSPVEAHKAVKRNRNWKCS